MKQVCKTRKIRKTFVNLINFFMGRCGIRSCRFSERFKQANLQSHWLSKIACFPTANEITNSFLEACLKRSEKRQERIPHRPIQKFNKFKKVFRIFLVLQIFS